MIEVAEKNKKKIVMFIQRGIFTAGLIELLECYFSQYYSFVFYTVKDDRFPLVERRSKIYEIDNTNIFLDEIKKIECDGIIISGLYFNPLPFNYKMDECVAKKLFVDFWGGDYTCFRIRYFFEDPYAYLVARRKLRIVRACGGWILEMQGDYPEICRHALCRKPNYVAPILTPGDIEEKELKITRIREDGNSTVNIQLGNSAAKENCHIAILRRLSHLKTENIKIYCPLSYSRTGAYADRVEKIGAKIFGDKFIPIKEFMSKEDYFLHERSYEFPIQVAVTVGALMVVDFSGTILMTMFTLGMFIVGYLLTQIIFYALYERLDNSYTLKPARNVPLMLFTLSVACMIFYAVSMCF